MTIKTSRQLKDKIANISGSDTQKAQTLLRKYMMERFLARISFSKYRDNFILKGGMLVSAIVGVASRATMDIDMTVRMLPLTKEKATAVINEIIQIDLGDEIKYEIKKVEDIMEEHDYSGVRFTVSALLEKLRDTIKIDISTGDKITPSAIEFSYPMMFEDEKLRIWSYNLETILAEKLETVIARTTLNTRMRDFYDLHILWSEENDKVNTETLKQAVTNVSRKRGSLSFLENMDNIGKILCDIRESDYLKLNWNRYREGSYYVGNLTWDEVMETLYTVYESIK